MRPNPFIKFLSPEDHLQHQVIVWLGYQHPELRYHHSPDAGKRTPFERFKYNYLGSDAGFLDLCFPSMLLAIELKVKPNKPTPAQLEWIAYLNENGWTAVVCYTFDETIKVITDQIKIYAPKTKIAGLPAGPGR